MLLDKTISTEPNYWFSDDRPRFFRIEFAGGITISQLNKVIKNLEELDLKFFIEC